MVYNGPANPTIFGSIRNTISKGHFSLSLVISYKLNYYFRKPALSYYGLFNQWNGLGTFSQRWQKPGDERITNVPSLTYAPSSFRDQFYANSETNVDRADNI